MLDLLNDVIDQPDTRKADKANAWLSANYGHNPLVQWLRKVTAFTVERWVGDSGGQSLPPIREEATLEECDVVSSLLKPGKNVLGRRHHVVLDIDYRAHLIPSSTRNHYHLVLEVPGGIEHEVYMKLLKDLGRAGVIESGYAAASIERGHSDIRAPWVRKGD